MIKELHRRVHGPKSTTARLWAQTIDFLASPFYADIKNVSMVIIAKFTTQDAQRYARAFASKNNNSQESQESQKTETESPNNKSQDRKDNQTAKEVNQCLEPEDTDDQAEIAQLQSQNQNQYDITGTDMALPYAHTLRGSNAASPVSPLALAPLLFHGFQTRD